MVLSEVEAQAHYKWGRVRLKIPPEAGEGVILRLLVDVIPDGSPSSTRGRKPRRLW